MRSTDEQYALYLKAARRQRRLRPHVPERMPEDYGLIVCGLLAAVLAVLLVAAVLVG